MKKIISLILSVILLITISCTALAEEVSGPKFVTLREWLAAKGDCGDCMLLLKILDVMNPVLALVGDETDQVNLYSGGEKDIILVLGDGDMTLKNHWIVIANPRYNEFEGTVELADWELLRIIPESLIPND